MKELNLNEMQELVADYSFGRLSKNESKIFENNLKKHPELKDEIIAILQRPLFEQGLQKYHQQLKDNAVVLYL